MTFFSNLSVCQGSALVNLKFMINFDPLKMLFRAGFRSFTSLFVDTISSVPF